MARGRVSVSVWQYPNPAHNSRDGDGATDKYTYRVVTVKNATRPAVGDVLTRRDVEDLIEAGTDVTVTEPK